MNIRRHQTMTAHISIVSARPNSRLSKSTLINHLQRHWSNPGSFRADVIFQARLLANCMPDIKLCAKSPNVGLKSG